MVKQLVGWVDYMLEGMGCILGINTDLENNQFDFKQIESYWVV